MAALYRTLTGQSQKSSHSKHDATALTPTSTHSPGLSKTTTTNTTAGVLNHLTEQQQHKLEEFKEKLQQDGWWSPDGVNGKPTHDDATLLRYLRARKFDVQGAIGQFTDTEKWMKEQGVDELYEHFDVNFYERARLMYPQWTGHRDRRGIPIYVFEIKGLDSKNVEKYQKESAAYKEKLPFHKNLSTPPKLLPLFALYHNLLNFVLPLCSSLERPRPEIPVTNSTNIVDISGVSLRQFWNLKNHMQDASILATAHYPETLDRIFIIGAPAFFPTVWGWIKRWFDPVTVSKIFILSKSEVKPTLEKFMDPSCFPKKYGGVLDWNWGDLPDLDEETRIALEKDGNKGWVKGPALWLNNERVVVGSENGKPRRSDKEIAEKKPIVYAADYTEEPVHAEKRRSTISNHKRKTSTPNTDGTTNPTQASGKPHGEAPNTLAEEHDAAAGAAAAATGASVSAQQSESPETPQQQIPNDPSIQMSPMGDSQVHPPDPAHEPVSTTATAAVAAALASDPSHPQPASSSAPHPPGHTQPGPLSQHTAEISKELASQLEEESTVAIPESANGVLPHPEVVSASDAAKGLTIEAEKLQLDEKLERPHAERFVTAVDLPQPVS